MRKKTKILLFVAIIILSGGGVFLYKTKKAVAPKDQAVTVSSTVEAPPKKTSSTFRVFTGEEFFKLYDSYVYPNTQLINEHTPITGNEQADIRIRQLAIQRGYKLRSAPVTDNFVSLGKDMMLQRLSAQPWLDMQATAKKDGLSMSLAAAYRSAEDQKTIFLQRLNGINLNSIASGQADAQVDKVLQTTALPGYSRHHTGYTIDIACDSDASTKFENSKCFTWLSKDNYLNAKKHGWIPSYPERTPSQGPNPESWEYVWVGTEVLK